MWWALMIFYVIPVLVLLDLFIGFIKECKEQKESVYLGPVAITIFIIMLPIINLTFLIWFLAMLTRGEVDGELVDALKKHSIITKLFYKEL